MTHDVIELTPDAHVAEGGERWVYIHPDDPTRVIKVLKPTPPHRLKGWSFGAITLRHIPSSRWRVTMKQYDEYRRLMLTNQFDPAFNCPVSHLYGFVKTTVGLGCISERVMDNSSNAKTLADLVKSKTLSSERLEALNAFVTRLYDIGICLSDAGPANFVYGTRFVGAAGAASPPEWVLVDGFGDRFAVPLRTWSERARIFGMDDAFKRAKRVPGLIWIPEKRRYALQNA